MSIRQSGLRQLQSGAYFKPAWVIAEEGRGELVLRYLGGASTRGGGLSTEERSFLASTVVWYEDVSWSELGAAVTASEEDAGQVYPGMVEAASRGGQ